MFIGRRTHVDAINTHGLLLESQNLKGYVPAKAATHASPLTSPDLILFWVKSADTEEAVRSLGGRPGRERISLATEAVALKLHQMHRFKADLMAGDEARRILARQQRRSSRTTVQQNGQAQKWAT